MMRYALNDQDLPRVRVSAVRRVDVGTLVAIFELRIDGIGFFPTTKYFVKDDANRWVIVSAKDGGADYTTLVRFEPELSAAIVDAVQEQLDATTARDTSRPRSAPYRAQHDATRTRRAPTTAGATRRDALFEHGESAMQSALDDAGDGEMRRSIFDCVTVADVLKRAGFEAPSNPKRLMRCPIHDDPSPSFRVFERGWRCFGCGRRGGIVDLILALGKASSRSEAARWLESVA